MKFASLFFFLFMCAKSENLVDTLLKKWNLVTENYLRAGYKTDYVKPYDRHKLEELIRWENDNFKVSQEQTPIGKRRIFLNLIDPLIKKNNVDTFFIIEQLKEGEMAMFLNDLIFPSGKSYHFVYRYGGGNNRWELIDSALVTNGMIKEIEMKRPQLDRGKNMNGTTFISAFRGQDISARCFVPFSLCQNDSSYPILNLY